MSSPRRPILISIVGPTAVGKTEVAIQLAQAFETVVVSADSRQFYREMSIGTAKPTAEELSTVPHYFIDSHHVKDNLSAGDFEREALELLKNLYKQYPIVILAGGSGLFVDALIKGLDDLPIPLPGIREKWNQIFAEEGLARIQAELQKVDPEYFTEVDINNPQRIIRALEVFESTGTPFSYFRKKQRNTRFFDTISIGLNRDRAELYDRINRRVDLMMEQGLLEEVNAIKEYKHLPALKTVGYAELFEYLEGKLDSETAIDKIKQNSRRYAKRQLTWFRKNEETIWFAPNQVKEIIAFLRKKIGV